MLTFATIFLLFLKGGLELSDKWTGNLIGKMHNAKITQQDIADELGTTKAYISMILNGKRTPKNAKQRLEEAFKASYQKKYNSN